MGRGLAQTEFSVWLDEQLKTRNWGVRTLARNMAPDDVERARRALNRYLFDGSYPNPENKAAIVSALGLEERDLPDYPFRSQAA